MSELEVGSQPDHADELAKLLADKIAIRNGGVTTADTEIIAAVEKPAEVTNTPSAAPAANTEKPAGDGKPAETVEELRELLRLERENAAKSKQERDRALEATKAFQRKYSELERTARPNIGSGNPRQPAGNPAGQQQRPAVEPDSVAKDVEKLFADLPELKPYHALVSRQFNKLFEHIDKLEERNAELGQALLEGVVPQLDQIGTDFMQDRQRAALRSVELTMPNWRDHYGGADSFEAVDPQTGQTYTKFVDTRMSPAFYAWLVEQDQDTQNLRFSSDAEDVAKMWTKFKADTEGNSSGNALPPARAQRLQASATPKVGSSAAPTPVDINSMSIEDQAAYHIARKKLEKQQRSA